MEFVLIIIIINLIPNHIWIRFEKIIKTVSFLFEKRLIKKMIIVKIISKWWIKACLSLSSLSSGMLKKINNINTNINVFCELKYIKLVLF